MTTHDDITAKAVWTDENTVTVTTRGHSVGITFPEAESLPSTVTDEMVKRAGDAYTEHGDRQCRYDDIHAALTAALTAAPTTGEDGDWDWSNESLRAATAPRTDWFSGAGSSFPSPKKGMRYQRERDEARQWAARWKEAARKAIGQRRVFEALATGLGDASEVQRGKIEGLRLALRKAQERIEEVERDREKAEKERDDERRELAKADDQIRELNEEAQRYSDHIRELESMTAREHLDAAWSAAHVPADGVIPEGAEFIQRAWSPEGGRVSFSQGTTDRWLPATKERGDRWEPDVRARIERRLLDPPTPKRPEGAEAIEVELSGLGPVELDRPLTGGEQAAVADFLAGRGLRMTKDGAA